MEKPLTFDHRDIPNILQLVKEEKRKTNKILETVEAGIIEWNRPSNKVAFNDTLAEILGYSQEKLKTFTLKDWLKHTHREDKPAMKKELRDFKENEKEQYEITHRFKISNGNYRWLNIKSRPLRNLQGSNYHWISIVRDVTEEKKLTLQLQGEREIMGTILNNIGMGIVVTDDKGILLYINPLGKKYIHGKKEEILGKSLKELMQGKDLQTGKTINLREKAISNAGGIYPFPLDFGYKLLDGAVIRVEGTITANYKEGILNEYIIAFRDITQEYEKEKEKEGISNVNLDMLFIIDSYGNFEKTNVKVEQVLGYTEKEIKGFTYYQLVHDEDWGQTLEILNQIKENRIQTSFTNRFRCKDGAYKHVEWYIEPSEGDILYASARDVTGKIQLEQQLRKQAIRDELTGIYNRHHLDSIILREMDRADRFNKPISIILFDLDHFKRVNDTYGHQVGDDILRGISQIVEKTIRESDILFRIGGEEFLILLPETSMAGAMILAEKVRIVLEQHIHPTVGGQTISLGVSERMKGESFRYLFKRADLALYQAKLGGRNQTIASEAETLLPMAYVVLNAGKEWETGDQLIDRQHQEILQAMNQLWESFHGHVSPNKMGQRLEYLFRLIQEHMNTEEEYLHAIGYREEETHRETHRKLYNKALLFKEQYKEGAVKDIAFLSHLSDELILAELMKEDKVFLAFAREQLGH